MVEAICSPKLSPRQPHTSGFSFYLIARTCTSLLKGLLDGTYFKTSKMILKAPIGSDVFGVPPSGGPSHTPTPATPLASYIRPQPLWRLEPMYSYCAAYAESYHHSVLRSPHPCCAHHDAGFGAIFVAETRLPVPSPRRRGIVMSGAASNYNGALKYTCAEFLAGLTSVAHHSAVLRGLLIYRKTNGAASGGLSMKLGEMPFHCTPHNTTFVQIKNISLGQKEVSFAAPDALQISFMET